MNFFLYAFLSVLIGVFEVMVIGYPDKILNNINKFKRFAKIIDKILNNINKFKRFAKIILLFLLLLFVIVFVISFVLWFCYKNNSEDYFSWISTHYHFVTSGNFGQIGDIIGGLLTPILTLFTLYFAYRTYRKDDIDKTVNSFLEQNRNLCKLIGDESFESMYNTFKDIYINAWCVLYKKNNTNSQNTICYECIKKLYNDNDLDYETRRKLTLIAYEMFYYGCKGYSGLYCNGNRDDFYLLNENVKPHNEFLGIYYRNLFQCIKYIDRQNFLSISQKKEYAKLVKTQMSDYAQLMLYYNSLTQRGSAWLQNVDGEEMIIKYDMIDNIPKLDSYVGIAPQERFPNYKFEFSNLEKVTDFLSVFELD